MLSCMNTFHFFCPQPPDLLSLTIEGERLRLVAISDEIEELLIIWAVSSAEEWVDRIAKLPL